MLFWYYGLMGMWEKVMDLFFYILTIFHEAKTSGFINFEGTMNLLWNYKGEGCKGLFTWIMIWSNVRFFFKKWL